jgi:SAM-dependent methyltransferase
VKRRTEGGRGPGRPDRPRREMRERPRGERRPGPRRDADVAIRYRDRDIAVLELPAGPPRSESDTLALLRARLETRGQVWAIPRLERGASGLVLLALSEDARGALARDERAQLRYFAVVESAGEPEEAPTGPAPSVLAAQHGRALVAVEHSASAESVLAGLARSGFTPVHEDGQLQLHGGGISLSHPVSGKWLSFESAAPQTFWRAVGSRSPRAEERPASAEPAPAAAPANTAESRTEKTSWDDVADWFDTLLEDRRHDHYQDLILPGTFELLELEDGGRVLDVACGQGVLSRALAERGVEAVGVDASERLIELARKRSVRLSPRPVFHVADARKLSELGLEPFERAACVMALSNVDPIEPVLRGCAGLLRERGIFVAVIPHPAFRIPRRSRWEWDRDEAGSVRQSRRVDGYLSSARVAILANPGEAARGGTAVQTWTFHRPLEHYVNALAAAGLWIDRIEEWASQRVSDSGPRAPEENRARREIPLFLALRARKLRAD